MKLLIANRTFIGFSAFALLSVAIQSIISPQATMNLVDIQLTNTDAISSIRGIYGGVGLCITALLVYLLVKQYQLGTKFLVLLWGFYALSRLITMIVDGPLGAFGNQWIIIETVMFVVSVVLAMLNSKTNATN